MAKLNNGYENISVELINFTGNDIARQCWEFGKHAEFYDYTTKYRDTTLGTIENFIQDIINGKTFPKYCFEGIRVAFKINNISRVCLAQLTREKGIFCSASGDVRPLTQDLIIPKAIYQNKNWRKRYEKINEDLEDLYCDLAEGGISYMDARYIMPHCQTISVSYSASLIEFVKSCASRTQNGFADEINYIYKLMRYELVKEYKTKADYLSTKLLNWVLDKSFVKSPYLRDHTYNNDYDEYSTPKDYVFDELPHNNIATASWTLELLDMYNNKPYLLTDTEKKMILRWKKEGIFTTYNKSEPYTLYTAIKNMNYYRRHKNAK